MTIGEPPKINIYWALPAWIALGMGSAFIGVYLIANTDTRVIFRYLSFAILCGFSWKPILEAGYALIQHKTEQNKTLQLSQFTHETSNILEEARRSTDEKFLAIVPLLTTNAEKLLNLSQLVNDYSARIRAVRATREIADLLIKRQSADKIAVRKAIDDLTKSATTLGALELVTYARKSQSTRIHWNLSSAFKTTLPGLGDNAAYLATNLMTTSDGEIVLKLLEPGNPVKPTEITDAVRNNIVDAGYTTLQYDSKRFPSVDLLSTRPYKLEPLAFIAWWHNGNGKKIIEELYQPIEIKPLLCGVTGPDTGGWFNRDIKTLEDLKGLKMRAVGFNSIIFAMLGANVKVLPPSEIYTALERKVIDGAEFSSPETDDSLGFYRVAKYNFFPSWQGATNAFHLVVNQRAWNRLKRSTQAQIETACDTAVIRNLGRSEAMQASVIEKWKKAGINVKAFPEAVMSEARRISKSQTALLISKDETFRRVYQSQKRFSEKYTTWTNYGYLKSIDK